MTPSNPACDRVRDRLERLLDGGLEPLQAARDEGHLESCGGCQAEARAWRQLFTEIREASRPAVGELSRVTAQSLRALADARGPSHPRALAGWGLALAAAAGLVAALTLDFSGLGWRPETRLTTAKLAPLTSFEGWGDFLPNLPVLRGEGGQ